MKSIIVRKPGRSSQRPVLWALVPLLCLTLPLPFSSGAANYQIIHQFTGPDGQSPAGELLLSEGTLYGAASTGGLYNAGAIFKLNPDGSGFAVLKHFTGGNESWPCGDLVRSGNTLYGTTRGGPDFAAGTVFKLNVDGSGYAVLKHFAGDDGWYPYCGLLLDNNVLYGTTFHGGSNETYFGDGTVFRLNTDGTGFTVLRRFSGPDGRFPSGGLTLSGTTLFGTTTFGGPPNKGTIFRIETDGSGFSQLFSFSAAPGFYPSGRLLLANSTLFGNTSNGGLNPNYGTTFKIGADGSGFSSLKQFNGTEGSNPLGSLTSNGTTLFGTAYSGGPSGAGEVFALTTDGSGFVVLKSFGGGDGSTPNAGLVLSGATLYGMASAGGISNCGVVFSLSLVPPSITNAPKSQTAEVGSAARFLVGARGAPPVGYQWFFNGTNLLAGGSRLQLTNVQPSDAGAYIVVVSDAIGVVTSAPAMLGVIPPVIREHVARLVLQAPAGSLLNLDRCDAIGPMPDWAPLDSVVLASSSEVYCDPTIPRPPQRFYRAWHTNSLSPPPLLDLQMVPALRLSGAVGDSLRVDYINQVGPPDAWVTLTVVTLTNTLQFYFDTSSLGQPERLYRIIQNP